MTETQTSKHRTSRGAIARWLAMVAIVTAISVPSEPANAFLARPILFLGIGTTAKTPTGWKQFCADNPADCRVDPVVRTELILTPGLLEELFVVNREVNNRVRWTSDRALYGKEEHWAYPLDRGDCEDFVLLKRRLLMRAGWSAQDLLITVVHDPNTEAGTGDDTHAVLTVRTNRGDLVLDNQTPEILFWYETPYRFIKRQTPADPNVWMSLLDERLPLFPSSSKPILSPPLALASR